MNSGVLYLLRHGEISAEKPRKFIGSTDLPLTDRGRWQIEKVSSFLAQQKITRLVCSPLKRCLESAEIISHRLGLPVNVEDDFKEIELGSWEGLTVDQVRRKYPGQYEARGEDLAHFRPQNGESFQDLSDRVWPAFSTLDLSSEKGIAVIAHGGVNRAIICKLLGMPLSNLFRLEQSYGCCNVIVCNKAGYQLKALNVNCE